MGSEGKTMLAKSRKSAIVMAAIALLTTATVYALTQAQFSSPSILSSLFTAGLFSTTEIAVAAGIALVVLALGSILASLIIYLLPPSRFGWRGAILWFVFGVISGLLLYVRSWLLPLSLPIDFVIVEILYRVLREFFGLGILLFSYWLVFRLVARLIKWDTVDR
jgi:hypothetical protein